MGNRIISQSKIVLPTIVISDYLQYKFLGHGAEGIVVKYDEKTALKILNSCRYSEEKIEKKLEKIELLGQLSDESACFPKGIIKDEEGKKIGYTLNLVNPHPETKNFEELAKLKQLKEKLLYIIQASRDIERFHKTGLVLGDISGENIMIDENGKIRFIDTDNWMFGGYKFDIESNRMEILKKRYSKKLCLEDNDRFLLALLAIEIIQGNKIGRIPSDKEFGNIIEKLKVSKETKDGLRSIFSDAHDKPYIGEILSALSEKEEEALNRFNR